MEESMASMNISAVAETLHLSAANTSAICHVFSSDPVSLDLVAFELWTKGFREEQVAYYKRGSLAKSNDSGSESDLLKLLYWDVVDQYRIFKSLRDYLEQPITIERQYICQISPRILFYMVTRYYDLDEEVVREMLSRKVPAKTRRDIDEIAEITGTSIGNCRRQVDNLRNIYSYFEERNFEGSIARTIADQYKLPTLLAERYTCLVFLLYTKIHISSKKKNPLMKLFDYEYAAALLLRYWVSETTSETTFNDVRNGFTGEQYFRVSMPTVDSNPNRGHRVSTEGDDEDDDEEEDADDKDVDDGAFNGGLDIDLGILQAPSRKHAEVQRESSTISVPRQLTSTQLRTYRPKPVNATSSLDLNPELIVQWRTLKNYFSVTRNEMEFVTKTAIEQIQGQWPNALRWMFKKLKSRYKIWFRQVLSIGAGLNQAKELRDLFEDIESLLVEPLLDIDIDSQCLEVVVQVTEQVMADHPFVKTQNLVPAWIAYFTVISKVTKQFLTSSKLASTESR